MEKTRHWKGIVFAVIADIVISAAGSVLYTTYIQDEKAISSYDQRVNEKEIYGNDMHEHQDYVPPSSRITP